MATKTNAASPSFIRSMAIGVILSMVLTYGAHVFGKWEVEDYRPDPETTSTVLLHNKCALFGGTHTLSPNTDISSMGKEIDGTKLAASFMNFYDGHVVAMVILSIVFGLVVFGIRKTMKKNVHKELAA